MLADARIRKAETPLHAATHGGSSRLSCRAGPFRNFPHERRDKSMGQREVMRFPSTTTSLSPQIPPAALMSSCTPSCQ